MDYLCFSDLTTLFFSSFSFPFTLTVKPEPVQTPSRPARSEEEVERKSKSIIDEFLHINDYKVLSCMCLQQRLLGDVNHLQRQRSLPSTLARLFVTSALCARGSSPCRRPSSAWRSWNWALSCTCLCVSEWSRLWSAVRSRGNTWASSPSSCCDRDSCQSRSLLKGQSAPDASAETKHPKCCAWCDSEPCASP